MPSTETNHPPFTYVSPPPSKWRWPILVLFLAALPLAVLGGTCAVVDEVSETIRTERADSRDDASVRSCEHDRRTGAVTATVEVTNDSSGRSFYVVDVELVRNGKVVGHVDAVLDDVDPDRTEAISVTEDVDGDVTCRLGEVERFAA